ncbi:MAG TPA: hypothetical protein VM305_11530 [Candidatus Limnocylindrales bacterium]|nr:hypothetical protein [Candidatus Limnocylindrales bacterium]
MTDELERRLRTSFVRADLPMAPERLRQVIVQLPATPAAIPSAPSIRTGGRLRLAAGLAVLVLVAGSLAFGLSNLVPAFTPGVSPSPSPTASPTASPSPVPSPTPSPAPDPTPTSEPVDLPEAADLLAGRPDVEVAWQGSEGPADRPVSDDATERELLDEPFELQGDLVLAAACRGSGELVIEMRTLNVPGWIDVAPGLMRPCDGHPTVIDYANFHVRIESIRIPAGASWRVAIGVVPGAAPPPTSFSESIGTDGWWQLWDVQLPEPASTEHGSGAGLRVADDVTRIGIVVECAGESGLTLTAVREGDGSVADLEERVSCPTDEPERFELSVTAGEIIEVKATPDVQQFVRVYIEADAMPVSTYGPVPDLPAELADVPFSVTNGTYVAMGMLGGSRQTLIPAQGASPLNRAAGDYAAVITADPMEGSRLELHSVSGRKQPRTLAQHPPGIWIRFASIDLEREQVLYEVDDRRQQQVRLHRVAMDGSGDRVVARISPEEGTMYGSARSGDTYMLDECQPDGHCVRWLLSLETLEATRHEVDWGGEVCDAIGTADGWLFVRVGAFCQAFGADEIAAMRLDGTGRRSLPDVGPASVVETGRGPQILHGAGQPGGLQLMSIETGESRSLGMADERYSRVSTIDLPTDWILLAPFYGIGDFPAHPMLLTGELPPLLVNVITGERIELTNLPH